MKKYFLSYALTATLLMQLGYSIAQNPQATFTLSAPESGIKNYVALENITLKPGFTYQASGANTFKAKIDPFCYTYALPDGTITSDPAAGGVVGSIPGQFDVSPSGAATYTIPIEVPAGINGMQPNVSLVYNSQAGNGIAGWGWSIGGLSMISRIPKNLYFDNATKGIDWTQESPLSLDGQRLIKTGTNEYKTESETFSKITTENIQSWGPALIKVETKNGIVMEYGQNGSLMSYATISNTKRLGWLLSKVYDQLGNYIKYNYSYGNGIAFKDHVLESISYGSNANGQDKEVGKIIFSYVMRSDEVKGYVDGVVVSNNLILNTITTYSAGALIRRYELNYATCNIQKSRLKGIDCYNGNGEKVNPTHINWNSTNKNVAVNSTAASFGNSNGIQTKDKFWYSSDVDGDGISELVAMYRYHDNAGQYWTYFDTYKQTNNSGTISFQNSGFYQTSITVVHGLYSAKITDLNNPWLVLPWLNKTDYWCNIEFTNVKTNTQGANINLKTSVNDIPVYSFGDMNNDGFDDIIVIEQAKYNNAYPLYIIYGNGDNKNIRQEINTLTFNGKPGKLILSDFNSDGLKDLIVVTDKGYNVISNIGGNTIESGVLKIGLSSGVSSTTLFNSGCSVINPGDFNGDGLLDFIINEQNKSTWYFAINQGSGVFTKYSLSAITAIEEHFTGKNDDKDQCIVTDFNNDGKDDIVIIEADYEEKDDMWSSPWGEFRSSYMAWYASTGTGVSLVSKIYTNREDYSLKQHVTTGDFNGDGRNDLVSFSSNLYNSNIKTTDKFFLHSTANTDFSDGFVASITNGLNEAVNISYKPMTDKNVYSIKSVTTNKSPIYRIRGPLYVASKASFLRDDISFGQYEYSYHTALIHTTGRGMLGFMGSTTKELITGSEERTENIFNTTFNTISQYTKERLVNGASVGKTTTDLSFVTQGTNRFFPQITSVLDENKINSISVFKSFSNYDNYGNPKTITTKYLNGTAESGISETQTITYVSKGSWCDNKVDYITTALKNANGEQKRSIDYDYDTKGNLKSQITDPGDVNSVKVEYQDYDAFGNPSKIITTANGKTCSTLLGYTSSGRFVASKTNVELGKTMSFTYDEVKGVMTGQTDEIGSTTYEYDGFGRLTRTITPDNVVTSSILQWAGGQGPSGAKYYVYTETTGQSPVKVWSDALGRELRRDSYGLNNMLTKVSTEYNAKGQLWRVSEPYFDSPAAYASETIYDSYGRPGTVTTPEGVNTYSYSNLTTKVTSPSGTTETTVNAAGQTTTSKVNGKAVNYVYYPSGLVKTSTPEGGIAITMEYDLQGNRTKIIDPVAGTIETQTNGLGELLSETRPGSGGTVIRTSYNYKQNGLLNTKTINGEVTQYVYDNERNRLKSIEISGKHKQEFTYDNYNRVIQVTEKIGTEKVYTTQTEYDALGRVSKEIYPSGYYILNGYDKYGYLTSVKDQNGKSIWEAKEANNLGQLTRMMQGGREIVNSYRLGKPTGIVSGSIINVSYLFIPNGNLYGRSDNIINNQSELFGHDEKNRLTFYDYFVKGAFVKNNSITYDNSTGAIISKSDIGSAMKYGEDNLPLSALSSIASNPDIIPDATQSITYTHFNKLATLIEGTNNLTLTYGVDQQRRKGVFNVDGKKLTRYYLGNYEEEVDANGKIRKLHYINTGNGLSAIYEQNGNTNTLYYTYCDYQGNLLVVTDEAGNVVERLAYDPWGARRNPDNWMQADTRTSHLFARGYTLHEHLDGFNLINMNGRVYDPQVARFLSPDPFVQAPGNWLNYDRYAYCVNNPLMYTDPSGEWFGIDDGVAFLIGGVVNLGVNLLQGNIDNFGEGLAAFGAGGAAGTLALYGPAGWAAGGAIVGGTNAWIGGATTGEEILMGVGVGAVSGLVGGAAGQWAAQGLGNVVINGLNIASPVLKGAITGAIGGAAGGYAGGYTAGLLMTGDFSAAHQAGMGGMLSGAALGGTTGAIGSYAYAKKNDINPWTGKYNKSIVLGRNMDGRVNPAAGDLNAETITNDWNAELGTGRVSDSKGLSFNRRWLNGKINDGYHIYDIGTGGAPNGKYYGLEQKLILNQSGVSKTFYWSNSKFRFIYYGK